MMVGKLLCGVGNYDKLNGDDIEFVKVVLVLMLGCVKVGWVCINILGVVNRLSMEKIKIAILFRVLLWDLCVFELMMVDLYFVVVLCCECVIVVNLE